MKAPIQSYKKVLFFVPAGFTAGFNNQFMAQGTDGISGQQVTNVDGLVPTGSVIKYFEIQFCVTNLVSTPIYINCTIQYKLSGQAIVDPNAVGGSATRNQVLHMDYFTVGANQNSTHKFKFKVPKRFQRIREGMDWVMSWSTNGSVNNSTQIIYKFYR